MFGRRVRTERRGPRCAAYGGLFRRPSGGGRGGSLVRCRSFGVAGLPAGGGRPTGSAPGAAHPARQAVDGGGGGGPGVAGAGQGPGAVSRRGRRGGRRRGPVPRRGRGGRGHLRDRRPARGGDAGRRRGRLGAPVRGSEQCGVPGGGRGADRGVRVAGRGGGGGGPVPPAVADAHADGVPDHPRRARGGPADGVVRTPDAHRLRRELAALLGWPLERIRVVVPDTGGAFGSKSAAFPEFVAVVFLALTLRRPVRWIEDRLESMLTATRGRGQEQRVRLAADADGHLLAYELTIDADVGAYPHLGVGLPMQTAWMAPGPYRTPRVHATVRSVLTNTMVTYPYRGAGRPEATIALERSMDTLARRLRIDPVELRRRNFIPPESFPYRTPTGREYDSGDYAAALDLALETLGYADWRAEQARRCGDSDALPLGIGLSCYVERSGGEPGGLHEFAAVEAHEDGTVVARCGAAPSGQGHETTFPALVAKTLGVDEATVRLVEGDTDELPEGLGSFASRSAQVAGAALQHACGLLIDEARDRAAGLWGVPVTEVAWSDGAVSPASGGSAMGLAELVKATGPLRVDDRFESGMGFPFGAHAAVVEVDPELGVVQVLRVVAVDDCGIVLNPGVVAGQAFGSAVQGIGQALYEGVPFDENGVPQLANGLLDYLVPTATEIPPITVKDTCTPSPSTPLGAKGAGESGCIGTPAAIVNAVADALRLADADLLQMPLTPDVVWRAARAPKLRESA
ncbi:molybdopterin cofactor-binding domain-containing protein [Streptomyces sp. FXJ1.4098]|nr:molybdopterin cofactor-binding domain-containing protein [Streptomyces sp. FXJ1.4098]